MDTNVSSRLVIVNALFQSSLLHYRVSFVRYLIYAQKNDISIMSILSERPSRSVEIAVALKLDKRTIHRHLTPLEKQGLIEGEYFQVIVKKQSVVMKKYHLSAKGKQTLNRFQRQKV